MATRVVHVAPLLCIGVVWFVPDLPPYVTSSQLALITVVSLLALCKADVRAMLENIGCEAEIAENGTDAVQALEKREFDPHLLACQIQVMDGHEATRTNTSQSPQRSIPVIALIANAMARNRELCLDSGMDDFLPNSIEQDNLNFTTKRWLQRTAGSLSNAETLKQQNGGSFSHEL